MVEYVCEGPDGYRPKMPQVPVRDAIRASAGAGLLHMCQQVRLYVHRSSVHTHTAEPHTEHRCINVNSVVAS